MRGAIVAAKLTAGQLEQGGALELAGGDSRPVALGCVEHRPATIARGRFRLVSDLSQTRLTGENRR